jgi:hypothetical protein
VTYIEIMNNAAANGYWTVTFENCADHAMSEIVAARVCALARAFAGTTPERPIVTTSDIVRKYGEPAAIWIHGSRTPANLRALSR